MGGPAHQAALLSGRRMDAERFETLLVHGSLAPGEESMADLAEREGARMVHLPTLGQPVNPANDLRALRSMRGIVRDFRPDIIHTHTAKAGYLGRQAALLARRPRPRLVHTYHGHVLEGYFGPLKTWAYRGLERRLARSTDRLIGVSQATVDDLVRFKIAPRSRFRVVPLGLDLSGYESPSDGASLRRELGLANGDVLAIFVGRVVPIKRLDLLIRAVAHARRSGARLHLAIVGDGELRPELERLSADLELGQAVHFLGYRRELAPLFAAANFAALSSENEGTPVSLIEGGAAGLPAVATDVGGVSEVVSTDVGILVPAGDHVALGAAMSRIAGDATLRRELGGRAANRMPRLYSAERLVGDVTELYRELAAPS